MPATHKCHDRPLYPKIFEALKKTWKGDGMDKEDPKLYLNQVHSGRVYISAPEKLGSGYASTSRNIVSHWRK